MKTLILTTPHEKGAEVTEFQSLLAKHGWYHGKIDGEFGPQTAQAVYRAKYHFGYPKKELNQHAGEILLGFLTGKRKPTAAMVKLAHTRAAAKPVGLSLAQRALDVAITQIGYKENPPDSNLTKYGQWYGYNGVAWCCIFVSWCSDQVGLKFRYAYVPAVVANARAGRNNLTICPSSAVKPGDLVCYDWPGESPGLADHIGRFERWIDRAKGQFSAIEGNTSLGNNSNGGEVMRREDRFTSEVQAFVRIGGSQ